MQEVPLSVLPFQTLQILLNGQQCAISVYTKTGYELTDAVELETVIQIIYFDLTVNGVEITNTQNCVNLARLLLNREYLGVVGDFVFIDTQGNEDPQWEGLGIRWVLIYLEANDVAGIEAQRAANS